MPARGANGSRYYTPRPRGNRGQLMVDSTAQSAPTAQDGRNEGDADFWNFVGRVAPTAGAALGAVGGGILGGVTTGGVGILPGAAAGGSLGYGLGQAGGQMATSHADSLTADREDEVENKDDRKAALLNALMSMRR